MLKDSKKVLDRVYDKIVGDLIVISNCKHLMEESFFYNIDDSREKDLDNLADSLTVVSSDIFTLKEILEINEETINVELLEEYGLNCKMIENFHLKLELGSYHMKELNSFV
ncbi:hypothetical protein [Staphylococcus phage vB_StaM_PB50]|nr:hypothetical protein [Staphylococcus phage vB_StaM_PB50]